MNETVQLPTYEGFEPPVTDPIEGKRLDTVSLDADTRLPTTPTPEVNEALAEQFKEVRGQLLEGLESNTEGLNIERARNFVKRFGLRADTEVWVLDEKNYEEFTTRRNQFGIPGGEDHGCYLPAVDMIVVKRDAEYEADLGSEFIEYAIVHELAHASADEEVVAYSVSGSGEDIHVAADVSRAGQVVLGTNEAGAPEYRGSYLEEGFADMVAKLYARNELDLPHGFGTDDNPDPVPVDIGDDKPIELPSELLNGEAAGRETVAVLGLMYLVDKDPSLMISLVKARRSAEGLREVANKISVIGQEAGRPQLYSEIQNAGGTPEGFVRVTRMIVEVTQPDIAAAWDTAWAEGDLNLEHVQEAGVTPAEYPTQIMSTEEHNEQQKRRSEAVRNIDEELSQLHQAAYDRMIQSPGRGPIYTPEDTARVTELKDLRAEQLRQFDTVN